MGTPSSGTISIYDINSVFGRGTDLNSYRGTTWYTPDSITMGTFSSGAISLSDFYNKQANDPASTGNQTFLTPGTYAFTVPLYRNSLTVQIWGAGGGGGGYGSTAVYSYAGGNSSFYNAYAYGGGGGQMAGTSRYGGNVYGAGGSGGTPVNGNNVATVGNAGYAGDSGITGVGAGAPNGGGNATPGYQQTPAQYGTFPGGGGAGFYFSSGGKFPAIAGGGGSGAYAKSIWAAGSLAVGSVITVVVGAGGQSGTDASGNYYPYGGVGGDGQVYIVWS
jgi:hypothetical protein